MATINPYLDFNGNAEEAFNFYKSVFGGEFQELMRWKDMPSEGNCGGMSLGEGEGEKLMHIALPIGDRNVLMASDCIEAMAANRVVGNNFSISVNTESKEETEKLYNGLSEGGTATMPPADSFWGSYFGMLTDKFGVQWLLNYNYKSGEEKANG
jgi:PhnB protein